MRLLAILTALLLFLPLVCALDDAYEPDDSYQNSTNIPTDGTWQTHNFSRSDDDDWLNFTAVDGAYYLIQTHNLSATSLTDVQLFLYDTDGTTKLSADEAGTVGGYHSAHIVWRATGAGTYYIQLNESGNDINGTYNVSVERQGTLAPYLVTPSSWTNVTKYQMFNFSAGVTCVGGPCRDVQAILDPEPKMERKPRARVAEGVSEEASAEGRIRVMVKLKDEAGMDRRDIGRKQDRVLGKLQQARGRAGISSADDIKVHRRYQGLNAFAGTVTEEGLAKLAEDPDVEYIYPDRRVSALLDVSVPLIDAKFDTWYTQVAGTNITGSGQTVCVIDTGINYSHPDFGGYPSFPNAKVLAGHCYCDDYVPGDSTGCCSDGDEDSSSGFIDDHSHGSHCAGIAASEDSTYTGVAPGAKLVAVKALDSGGSGWMSDVAAGVDWCVANADTYNISVISMSIGTWYVYDNNGFGCEDFDPTMTQAVNNAVADDIFIAIAAGNRYTSGDVGVASPGCIYNATSVGISDDSNNIVSWGQRGFNLDLMAPGNSILATDYDGTHMTKSGTSMSTPHVAGAAALVQQFFRLQYDRTLTPKQIEWVLHWSGFQIYDAVTDMTYYRINTLDAISSKGAVSTTVGATPFYTTTSNPHDSSCLTDMASGESCNMTWEVNSTGDFGNYTFFTIFETDYMSNITAKINITIKNDAPVLSSPSVSPAVGNTTTVFNYTVNYSDVDGQVPVFILVNVNGTAYSMLEADASDSLVTDGKIYYYQTTLTEGNYTYYFNASDAFNTTTTTVTYAPNVTDNMPPLLSIAGPVDNANVSSAVQQFSFNVSDESATTINCSLGFDGSVVNYTVVTNNLSGVISYAIPAEGSYLWNVSCSDGSNSNTSSTRNITYDASAPIVYSESPADDTVLYTNSSDFGFNASDNLFSTMACVLYAGGSASASNSSVANATSTTFSSVPLAAGSLSWYVNCTDSAGNSNTSSASTIIVPEENVSTAINATVNTTLDIDATEDVDINISTVANTTGTVAVTEFNTNPSNTSATTTNGFAALGVGTFVSINASAEIEGNLSWYLLTIHYSQASLPSNIRESSLRVYYYNSSSGDWEQEPDSGVDTGDDFVWANITHFSIFSVGGSAESSGSTGGGGGGGGGGATASSEPIAVSPTFSPTLVEAPKNQKVSVAYEGSNYLFKVSSFTGSTVNIQTLPDLQTYVIGNGLSRNFDVDSDGRDDIQIVYSGKYDNQALVVFYKIDRPEPIPLLPPAPRKPREEAEVVDVAEEEYALPSEQGLVTESTAEPMPEPEPELNFFQQNSRFLTYLIILGGISMLLFMIVGIWGRSRRMAAAKQGKTEKPKDLKPGQEPVLTEVKPPKKKTKHKKPKKPSPPPAETEQSASK